VRSGESISTPLPPGTYTLIVRDVTAYPTFLTLEQRSRMAVRGMPVHIETRPYTTAEIVGRISIPESGVTMPVSMRVAEFEGAQRIDVDRLDSLKPDMPVWVIVHGRNDNEGSDQMEELARNLRSYEVQVVSVDWSKGAADNITPIGLEGSKWIEAVGAWTTNQLRASGFDGEKLKNIYLIGHSWGSFVAYEIAKHTGAKVGGIIALDPAADSALLGGHYDTSQVDFSFYAEKSYAFHSSMFGNRELALTATQSFRIKAPEGYEGGVINVPGVQAYLRQHYAVLLGTEVIDEVFDAWREHGFAVTLFSSLLRRAWQYPNEGPVAPLFTPLRLSTASAALFFRRDNYEGIFFANPTPSAYTKGADAGKTWWKTEDYLFYGQSMNGNPIEGK
jgi:pimeloyl-ACP methyl ester carboxylesterase